MGVAVEMTADDAKLMRRLARQEQQLEKLQEKYKQLAREGQRAGTKTARSMKQVNDDAFGDKAIGKVTRYVAGIASIAAVANLGRQALGDLSRQADELSAKQRQSEMGMASLAQLAMGDPKKHQQLIATAEHIYRMGGAATEEEAARTTFALESAGALGEAELFARLYGIVGQTDVMARAATTLQTSMGKKETGDLRAIMSKGFGASQFTPATAEALLEGISRAGGFAKMQGISDEELLSAAAIMAKATGSAEMGGTTVASLLASIVKGGEYTDKYGEKREVSFEGLTLAESVQKIKGLDIDKSELQTLLGRKEAVRAYTTLADNQELMKTIEAEVTAAQEGDLLGRIIESRDRQPKIAAALYARQTTARRDLALEEKGIARTLSDAAIAEWEARKEESGGTRIGRWFGGWMMRRRRWMMPGGDEAFLEATDRRDLLAILRAEEADELAPKSPERIAAEVLEALGGVTQALNTLAEGGEAAANALQRASEGSPTMAPAPQSAFATGNQ